MATDRQEDRVGLIVRTAGWLFLSSAALGYFLLNRAEYPALRDYAVVLGPLASATLVYIAASLAIRDLHAPGRLVFPLNLTLPVVFTLLIRVSVILWASPSGPAFRTPDALLPALVWTNPLALALLALIQCALLTLLSFVSRETRLR
jgi:hypothetical protein